jgi:nucleoporin NUP82
MSPFGEYLAIVCSHTIHMALLPGEYETDIGLLKLKTFQLGPTEHVLEGAPVVSVVWHPLGPQGRCLVTITEDAIIRLWEINRENRSSFEKCGISIDLQKLVNAKDEKENLRASIFGAGKAFSPDTAYLEPVSATFGALGRAGENPWSSMTLWIAMRDGDIYALSPLLPSKFLAYPGMMSSLSRLLSAKTEEMDDDDAASPHAQYQLRQQGLWIQDLEDQDPFIDATSYEQGEVEIYTRPSRPRPEPRLQGPIGLPIDDIDISDLFVRNLRVGEEPLEFETGELLEDEDDTEPMDISIVGVLGTNGVLYTFLDIDGVDPEWLPSATPHSTPRKSQPRINTDETHDLILLSQSPIVPQQAHPGLKFAPLLTPDVRSSYSFFITHENGVSYISFDSLVEKLQLELQDPSDGGSDFRIDVFLSGTEPLVEQLIQNIASERGSPTKKSVLACSVFTDSDLGYFVLMAVDGHPFAASLDTRYRDVLRASTLSEAPENSLREVIELPGNIRQPYQADNRFFEGSTLARFLDDMRSRQLISSQDEKLTPETLKFFIEAHKAFSIETQRLGEAAARTYRVCSHLLNEFNTQIHRLREITSRLDDVTGEGDDDFTVAEKPSRIEQRLLQTTQRHHELQARCKRVQKKLGILSGRQMSEKEKEFSKEAESIEKELEAGALGRRLEQVKKLKETILSQSKDLSRPGSASSTHSESKPHVPVTFRKARMGQVVQLLERETAMIESAMERLQRLNIQLS